MYRLLLDWLQALMRGAVETLSIYPLLVLLLFALEPHQEVWLWAAGMALEYTLGYILRVHSRLRKIGYLMGASLFFSTLFSIAYHGAGIAAWFGSIIGAIWMYRGMRSWGREWFVDFPIAFRWAAVFIYLLCSFLYRHFDSLSPYVPQVEWLGLVYLIYVLLWNNEELIHTESLSHLGRSGMSRSVRSLNRVLVLFTTAAWILIGSIGFIRRGVAWLGEKLSDLLEWFRSLFGSPDPEPIGDLMEAATPIFPMNDAPSTSSPIWEMLLQILFVMILCAAGAALMMVLYTIVKQVVRKLLLFYGKLVAYLSGSAQHEEDQGYVDENIRLFHLRSSAGAFLNRVKGKLSHSRRFVKYSELHDNRERVRYLFRRLLRQHVAHGYQYKPYFTPQETTAELGAQAAGVGKVYTKARYGKDQISDEEVDTILHQLHS